MTRGDPEDKDVTPAHGHLEPVVRQVEDYQNGICRHLLYSPPERPMPCLYSFLFLLLYALWLLWVGPALGSLVGLMLLGGLGNGDVVLVAAACEGMLWAPGLGRHQQPWCISEACAHPSSIQPHPMAFLLDALAPAWHVHIVGCTVRNPFGVCTSKVAVWCEVLHVDGAGWRKGESYSLYLA